MERYKQWFYKGLQKYISKNVPDPFICLGTKLANFATEQADFITELTDFTSELTDSATYPFIGGKKL